MVLQGDCNWSEKRAACVRQAYDSLDANKNGCVKLDQIAQGFDPSGHPAVIAGKQTERDAYMEYMGQFNTQERDGVVSFDEFCEVHKNMSCGCADCSNFVTCIKNCYKC